MKAIEFVTELHGQDALDIPRQVAAQLPDCGKARVILLFPEDSEDNAWRMASYEQFMKEDASEDSVYDKYAQTR